LMSLRGFQRFFRFISQSLVISFEFWGEPESSLWKSDEVRRDTHTHTHTYTHAHTHTHTHTRLDKSHTPQRSHAQVSTQTGRLWFGLQIYHTHTFPHTRAHSHSHTLSLTHT